jgi:hypothetical protein
MTCQDYTESWKLNLLPITFSIHLCPRSHHLISLPLFDFFVAHRSLSLVAESPPLLRYSPTRPSPVTILDSRLGAGTISLGETTLDLRQPLLCHNQSDSLFIAVQFSHPATVHHHIIQRTSFSLSIARNRHPRPCTISLSATPLALPSATAGCNSGTAPHLSHQAAIL